MPALALYSSFLKSEEFIDDTGITLVNLQNILSQQVKTGYSLQHTHTVSQSHWPANTSTAARSVAN
jgi:hypothetical protein